jgi:hypothetical protein
MPELLKLAVTREQFCERRPAGRCEAWGERPLIPKTMDDRVRAASQDVGCLAVPFHRESSRCLRAVKTSRPVPLGRRESN